MNLKIANLVAIQFGIFIGIMSWLGYSRLPSAEPRTAAGTRERTAESVATFAPVFEPGDQHPQAVDRADREGAQPIAEQTAQAARDYSALAAQLYYQQIAPRRYASSGLENNYIVADAPSYTELPQAAAELLPEDVPAPQTVAYAQPAQFVAYPAETVVFSNSRSFGNRCRSTRHTAALNATTHRRPNRGGSHQNVYQVVPGQVPNAPSCRPIVPGQIPNAPSCRPIQGFRPRGNR